MSYLIDNLKKIKSRQSNDLNTSPYAQEFTAHEIKLFEISLAACSLEDLSLVKLKTDKELIFSNHELAALLNTKPNVISMEIEKTAARIMRKTIHLRKILEDESIEFEIINIIPYARYKNGQLNLSLNYRVISYLLEIKKSFTEFELRHLLAMNSSYSIKLYKLLYQFKNIKIRSFAIDDLKSQFGIIDKYPNYYDFKKNIINPSILQINNFTDLTVDYSEIKFGRKIEKIEFKFELKKDFLAKSEPINQTVKAIEIKQEPVNIDSLLSSIGVDLCSSTKNTITKYYEDKGLDYVQSSIDYAKKNARTNLDKYLSDTLTKGWAEVELKKSSIKKAKTIEKTKSIKIEQDKKQQEKEQDNLNKSMIEHEWNKLLYVDKSNFTAYANFIITKYSQKLLSFKTIQEVLPLCIYAISNGKSYDRMLESYAKNALNLSLNINEMIVSS